MVSQKIIATWVLGLGLSATMMVPPAIPQPTGTGTPGAGQSPPQTVTDLWVQMLGYNAALIAEIKRVEDKLDKEIDELRKPPNRRGETTSGGIKTKKIIEIVHVHPHRHYYPCCAPCPPWEWGWDY
jgi:hypothetical protein